MVSASGCPSGRWSSAAEGRSLLLLPPVRRGVKSPRVLRFKCRRLPRGAGREAAAEDRHAAALAGNRRYAAAVGFCTKNHCILVRMAGVGASVRPSVLGGEGGEGCGNRGVRQKVCGIPVSTAAGGAPFQIHSQTHTLTRAMDADSLSSSSGSEGSQVLWLVRTPETGRPGESVQGVSRLKPNCVFSLHKSPYKCLISASSSQ